MIAVRINWNDGGASIKTFSGINALENWINVYSNYYLSYEVL